MNFGFNIFLDTDLFSIPDVKSQPGAEILFQYL